MTVLLLPSAQQISNQYKYGMFDYPTDPNFRPTGQQTTIGIDTAAFMATVGRFAVGANFGAVNYFMNVAPSNLPPGTYSLSDIISRAGAGSSTWAMKHMDYEDGIDDFAERTYIYNSQQYRIHPDAVFIVDPNGVRHIENYLIIPDNDNFDYVTDWPAQLGNEILQNIVDVAGIGSKVLINFINQDQLSGNSYTQLDYNQDVATKSTWTDPTLAEVGVRLTILANEIENNDPVYDTISAYELARRMGRDEGSSLEALSNLIDDGLTNFTLENVVMDFNGEKFFKFQPNHLINLVHKNTLDAYQSGLLAELPSIYVPIAPFVADVNEAAIIQRLGWFQKDGARIMDVTTDSSGNDIIIQMLPNGVIQTITGHELTNGQYDSVTAQTTSTDGRVVEQVYEELNNENKPTAGPQQVVLHNYEATAELGEFGGMFGSQFGQLIAGDNVFARIGGATVGATIAENVFEFVGGLGKSLLDGAVPNGYSSYLDYAVSQSLGNIADETISNLKQQTYTVLSSLLMAELAEALGIDGFEGKVFSAVGGTVTGQLISNLQQANWSGNVMPDLAAGFDIANIITSLGSATGSLIGSALGSTIVDIDSVGESIFAGVGGAYLGLQGASIGSSLAIVGPLAPGVAASISSALMGTSVGNLMGTTLGGLLLPGIGALFGAALGQVIGSAVFELMDFVTDGWFTELFDFTHEWYYDYLGVDASNNLVVVESTSNDTTVDLRTGVQALTAAYLETINSIIDSIGGKVDLSGFVTLDSDDPSNPVLNHAYFGYHHSDNPTLGNDDFKVVLGDPYNYVNANGDMAKLVRVGVEYELGKMKFVDGNLTKVRALDLWKQSLVNGVSAVTYHAVTTHSANAETGESLDTLMSYLQIAEDYSRYLEDAGAINALIAAAPDSAFTIGWIATLMQAEALGLNDAYIVNTWSPTLDLDNTFIAADGNDVIYAGVGNDVVKTYGGNDIVNGGAGNDTIELGDGDDQVWAEDGNDIIKGGAGNDVIDGGAGADNIDGGTGVDTVTYNGSTAGVTVNLNGTAGVGGHAQGDILVNVETLLGSNYADTLTGSAANDSLHGRGGNDTIYGGAGNDWIVGDAPEHSGADTLYGGDGNDKIEGGAGNDQIYGDAGNDEIYAGANNDTVWGGAGIDKIFGDDGDDTIDGGDGDDVIWGGTGNDTVSGGLGNDRIYADVGNDILNGGAGADEIFGYDGDDTINGGDGDDLLAGEKGNDTIYGGVGNDVIYTDGPGSIGNDTAYGGDGDDIIKAGGGNDTIYGDAGNDSIYAEEGDDIVSGGLGDDLIHAGAGNDQVTGGDGKDTILGYEGDDTLSGDAGDDLLYGLSGNDALNGGIGADKLYGDVGNDTLNGDDGDDFLDGWHGNDVINGGAGNDVIAGGDGNDTITGGSGNDVIYGDRQPNPNALPAATPDILNMIQVDPGYDSFGLLYQGAQYTLAQLKAASHQMLIINPSKDALTNLPHSEVLWTASEITELKSTGKTVIGYVNLAKINTFITQWNDSWTTSGVGSGELTSAAPTWLGKYESSTTRLVDFTNNDFQELVFDRVEMMINQGFNGTLLDDVLEYYFRVPSELTGLAFETAVAEKATAMRDFIIDIREFADVKIQQKYGTLTAANRFQLIVNGAPYIMKDAIMDEDILSVSANQTYLDAIDAILVENYFSRNTTTFIDDTISYFGDNGVPMLSIDTDQVTQQQRIQIITDAINKGFLPYTTENSTYDVLNGTFLAELADTAIAGDDVLEGGAGADMLYGGAGSDSASYASSSAAVNINLLTATYSGGDAAGDVYNSIENIIGSAFADTLTGDDNANILRGGAGADTINGGNGNDTVSYAGSTSAVTVNLSTNIHSGGDAAGDTISNVENITGSDHNDVLTGTSAVNILRGGAGNDTLIGGAGSDTLDGGDGLDTVSYAASASAVTINLATNVNTGGDAAGDSITNVEDVIGSAYNDAITGTAAANTLNGGAGADTLNGGDGLDTVSYINSMVAVTVNLTTNVNTGGDAQGDSLSSIENVTGSNFHDLITGTSAANILIGGLGSDTLYGGGGNDTLISGGGYDAIYGEAGEDILIGGAEAEGLYGGDGHDVIEGWGGADSLIGGNGIDYLVYANSDAGVTVNLATNTVSGGHAQGDTISGFEYVQGSAFLDVITGDATANVFYANAGNDTLNGGDGDDLLVGGEGADTLNGGNGNDWAYYHTSASGVTVSLVTGATNTGGDAAGDVLSSIEHLYGSTYNDTLIGSSAANILTGNAGNDILIGGAGADTLNGDDGSDTASYITSSAAVNIYLAANSHSGGDAAGDSLTSIENVTGSNYNDTLIGGVDANILSGGLGNDALKGLAGADTLNGGDGTDTAYYDGGPAGITINLLTNINTGGDAAGDILIGIENIYGTSYNDTLTGDANANALTGGDGNDVMEGGAGGDALVGGNGIDYLVYANSDAGVTVNLATNTVSGGHAQGDTISGFEYVQGSAFLDVITGDATANVFYANAGNDTLNGGDGDDLLVGGEGADTLNGGNGNDWAYYHTSASGVTVSLVTGAANTGGDAAGDVLSSIEHLYGSTYNDTLIGSSAANILTGNAGNDILIGGAGADTLNGDDGSDTASYLTSSAAVIIYMHTAYYSGGDATGDVLNSIENITGSAFNDQIVGTAAANILSGGAGNDSMNALAGDDTLYGDDGDDGLQGEAGADVIDGGSGVDTAYYSSSTAGVTVNLVTNINTGGHAQGDSLRNIENVYGSAYNDILTGTAAANTLTGADGNDQLEGGAGADIIDGGNGIDAVLYTTAASAVTASLKTGVGTVGDAAGDTFISIENMFGSSYNDHLTGSDVANTISAGAGDDIIFAEGGNDIIYGGDGNDQIWGGAGADSYIDGGNGSDTVSYSTSAAAVTVNLTTNVNTGGDAAGDVFYNIENIFGSHYNDMLTGDAAANTLHGFNGNDTLNGMAGNDILIGGVGSDTMNGGDGNDTVSYAESTALVKVNLTTNVNTGGEAQGDSISNVENVIGSAYADELVGNSNANILEGGLGADYLYGMAGNDALNGGDGNDYIEGGDGDDLIDGGLGSDYIDGGAGNDTLSFATSSAFVSADLANNNFWNGDAAWDNVMNVENLTGSDHDDFLYGNSGANILNGGRGNDTLSGGNGNDILIGGVGKDLLTGGAGNDIFRFKTLLESTTLPDAYDVIQDFVLGQDKIDVSGLGFTSLTAGATPSAGHLGFYSSGGDTFLTDGDNFSIKLVGNIALTNSDLIYA